MVTINIPPPRIPVIDPRTGMMAQAWYRFFAQFLQGLNDDVASGATDLTALTTRVLVTETDISALEAEDANLFVDLAMDVAPTALIDALSKRVFDLETDYRPDPTAEIDELRKRVAELETELALSPSPLAAIEELRRRVADLETDMGMK
jgi:predicted RNase H-like nuclease (RuvC/YqgF family)